MTNNKLLRRYIIKKLSKTEKKNQKIIGVLNLLFMTIDYIQIKYLLAKLKVIYNRYITNKI